MIKINIIYVESIFFWIDCFLKQIWNQFCFIEMCQVIRKLMNICSSSTFVTHNNIGGK